MMRDPEGLIVSAERSQPHYDAGALRVHVVGEGGGRDAGDGIPAHQLAWDCDLVIATFQQLSSQWSRHREGKPDGAPLLQARRIHAYSQPV